MWPVGFGIGPLAKFYYYLIPLAIAKFACSKMTKDLFVFVTCHCQLMRLHIRFTINPVGVDTNS